MRHTTLKQIAAILGGTVECSLEHGTGGATRRQDDTDGSLHWRHELYLTIGPDGDMYVKTGDGFRLLRFRNAFGGGISLRTHNALRMLAEAVRLDNEEHPQEPRSRDNRERWDDDFPRSDGRDSKDTTLLPRSLFLTNLHHAFAKEDGTYAFPDSTEGDLLKRAKVEIEGMLEAHP